MALYNKLFYHKLLRKYTIAFGSLFNDIYVERNDSNGNVLHTEKVGLTYSAKSKFFYRLHQDGNLDRKPAIKLPKMAFSVISIAYAPERKITSKRKISATDPNDPDKKSYIYTPLPYDINYSLSIVTKSQDEGLQIIEQIVPFFTPDYTITMKGIQNPDINFDVPINLIAVNPDDTYEGQFDERRMITWELDFVMKAYMFGPSRSGSIIKSADTELYDDLSASEYIEKINVEPFIEGVPLSDITEEDDFDILTTIE